MLPVEIYDGAGQRLVQADAAPGMPSACPIAFQKGAGNAGRNLLVTARSRRFAGTCTMRSSRAVLSLMIRVRRRTASTRSPLLTGPPA